MNTSNSCRVIVSCFRHHRSGRNNSPPSPEASLNFLKKVLEKENSLESKERYDIIIINHDAGYEEGNKYIQEINNTTYKNGKILSLTTENRGLSFDGYSTSFKLYKELYENWIFSEDDHMLLANNYYDIFLEEYENYRKKDNIGFLAFAPIAYAATPRHSGGGFGLCKRESLNEILELYKGELPCMSIGMTRTAAESYFTNAFEQIGKMILPIKFFSCYSSNHYMLKDHTIHRNSKQNSDNGNYFFQVGPLSGEEW